MTIDLITKAQQLDREAIACRAYELYLARGCEDGCDVEDWLTAEAQLLQETSLTQQEPTTGRSRRRGSPTEGKRS